jgi:hypothetical protein
MASPSTDDPIVAASATRQLRALNVLPTSRVGRVLAYIWLGACVAVLIFAYAQRAVHDMPEAFGWLMLALSCPLGLVAVPIVGISWSALLSAMGLQYQPFRDELPIWLIAVVVGYWQWFVLIPSIARRIRSSRKQNGA